jgi:predicted transcriptional regulator
MIQCQLCDFSNSDSILSHVRVTHGLSSKEYKTKFPNSPLRKSWMQNNEIALSEFREVGHANKERRKGKVGHHKLNDGQWSKSYEKCLICSKTDSKHMGHGICKKCLSLKQQLQKTCLKNEKLSSSGIEGEDFVICKECGKPFECLMTNGHLKIHNMTEKSYQEKHGENSTRPSNLASLTRSPLPLGRG